MSDPIVNALKEAMIQITALQEQHDVWRERARELASQVQHWKANHADVVQRLKVFTDRPDLPAHMMERRAYVYGRIAAEERERRKELKTENAALRRAVPFVPAERIAENECLRQWWDEQRALYQATLRFRDGAPSPVLGSLLEAGEQAIKGG